MSTYRTEAPPPACEVNEASQPTEQQAWPGDAETAAAESGRLLTQEPDALGDLDTEALADGPHGGKTDKEEVVLRDAVTAVAVLGFLAWLYGGEGNASASGKSNSSPKTYTLGPC